ncbi:MAG: hypothetical protein ABW022_07520, partial [Actinoplanes sp.]
MDAAIAMLVSALTLAAILAALVWLARRVRRSGVGAQLMSPIDQVFNADGHRYRQVIEVQDQRMVAPSPADDKLRRDWPT